MKKNSLKKESEDPIIGESEEEIKLSDLVNLYKIDPQSQKKTTDKEEDKSKLSKTKRRIEKEEKNVKKEIKSFPRPQGYYERSAYTNGRKVSISDGIMSP